MKVRWTVGLLSVAFLVLLDLSDGELASGVWMLPAPSRVFMESVDMRHTLRWWWRPLQAPCNASVLYSVQFQGEFELTVLNGSWVDAPECQRIRRTRCDLTFDLGSDSDYNLRVRAQCGSRLSAWAELGRPFNRRDTVLAAPEMTVTAAGDALQVSFDGLPPTAVVSVTLWKRGDELQAAVHAVPAGEKVLHVAGLQAGAVYCVSARTVLDTQLQSASTDARCVSVAGPDAAWKRPTTVTVTVLIMAGLLLAVSWAVAHCRADACHKYFRKEQLPRSLQSGWDVQNPTRRQQQEICGRIDAVDPERRVSDAGAAALAPRLGEQSSELAADLSSLPRPREIPRKNRPDTLDSQERPLLACQVPAPKRLAPPAH